jgi:large subunit ribosomal protein L31
MRFRRYSYHPKSSHENGKVSCKRGFGLLNWPVFLDLYQTGNAMKPGIHPNYREVVFQDLSSDFAILTRSTIETKETIKWEDGNDYPLVKVEISSASHPFYTGKHKLLDSGGRVDKFKKRYGK